MGWAFMPKAASWGKGPRICLQVIRGISRRGVEGRGNYFERRSERFLACLLRRCRSSSMLRLPRRREFCIIPRISIDTSHLILTDSHHPQSPPLFLIPSPSSRLQTLCKRSSPSAMENHSPLLQTRNQIPLRALRDKARHAKPARLLIIPRSTIRPHHIAQDL
jgi:hypothetical protein